MSVWRAQILIHQLFRGAKQPQMIRYTHKKISQVQLIRNLDNDTWDSIEQLYNAYMGECEDAESGYVFRAFGTGCDNAIPESFNIIKTESNNILREMLDIEHDAIKNPEDTDDYMGNTYIELHRYKHKPKVMPFAWHTDDDGPIRIVKNQNNRIFTIIFYLKKPDDEDSGNLHIQLRDCESQYDIPGCRTRNECLTRCVNYMLNIEERSIVVFDETTRHIPQSVQMEHNMCRDSIVVLVAVPLYEFETI